jgi:pimeloyl-ACP methyl ester carboxylesterase
MPTIEANGQTLYYEVHGEGEPLVCVMGLAANSLAWALQVQAFAERHRTVIFDNRDVGQSSMAQEQYEIHDMARDTLALADGLGLDSFHLLGYSMGGAISQEVALTAPERVRTLTLAVTYAGTGNWGRKFSEVWGGAGSEHRARSTSTSSCS